MSEANDDIEARTCPSGLDRREFLAAGAGIAAALAAPGLRRAAYARGTPGRGAALNLIFCVSDGMSSGTLTMADMMIRAQTGKSSRWLEFQGRSGTRRAMLNTSSADSLVTDSAAASATWGIGEPVNNESIGMTPDGRLLSPILLRAKEAGKATGLVTTTRLSHATPAGFIACVPTGRDDEAAIAEQILERGVDVMLGGGAHYLTDALLAKHTGVHVVRTREELAGSAAGPRDSQRLLGLFAEQHMSYEIERPDSEPTLAEMTRVALARLSRAPGGFAVQIEGGRVDHAAHSNDAASMLRDQVAFDEAIGVAIDFASARDDTLVILTTDHGNANPGLTEYGIKGNKGFERLAGCRRSFDWVIREVKAAGGVVDGERLRAIVRESSGVTLEDHEVAMVLRAFSGEAVDPYLTAGRSTGPLGSVLANHFGVAFLSPNHTSDYVELLAAGPGSEGLPAYLRHRDVHRLMIEALDLPEARVM
ncbi:MAG: alkaline phosphatase [Phycisphaerae bacterium]|nr:alkaline phosphatase [Phycisphaerae bacterium]